MRLRALTYAPWLVVGCSQSTHATKKIVNCVDQTVFAGAHSPGVALVHEDHCLTQCNGLSDLVLAELTNTDTLGRRCAS